MFHPKFQPMVCALALAGAVGCGGSLAHAGTLKKVFVIAMENHNWTQPSTQTSPQQIYQNPAAPFINSLVNGTSGISSQVAFANAYINAISPITGVGTHPSEPNYIWTEAGTDFGVTNDADPCPSNSHNTTAHLSGFLTVAGKSWRSYQEDTDVDLTTNTPLPASQWTVPLTSHSGFFTSGGVNAYNYSSQYNYAAKHNPMVFFNDTNGGCDLSTANSQRLNYAPLQQLALDLANNTTANYNWITPDQYNDQHSTLANGYGKFTGDSANIAQGDNFLARVVPLIMASDAYQDHGVIVLWWDESEGGSDPSRTLPFIVISQDVHQNVNGAPYSNMIQYSHSSFLRTMQEIFHVDPPRYIWLGGAAAANDLSDLFSPGAVK